MTETGSGDETLTVVKVPLAYDLTARSLTTGALTMEVTIPVRPGTKGIVYTEELEARYRLRDRATGRVNGGWITESAVPASSPSVTFGPVPAGSDFDVAIRAISREKKTASDWNAVTGNGPSDRPTAPTMIQVNSGR